MLLQGYQSTLVHQNEQLPVSLSIISLTTRLIVMDIAQLTVLFFNCPLICNCPLLNDIIFNDFFCLLWLNSNHMFGLSDFGDKSPLWFLKILKLVISKLAISKFSKMHSGNLSQTALPDMWLLVLIQHRSQKLIESSLGKPHFAK